MSTPTEPKSSTKQRKAKHLSICINPHEFDVEHGSAGFEGIRFLHHSLPELDVNSVDTTENFLGHQINAPLFISCMTGGSDEGFRANRNLAIAAEAMGLPVGMGSIRVLFEHEDVFDHFHLKKLAPNVPVLANIGGVQVREVPHAVLVELVKRLEADALVVHLNPGQELFQPDGDRDFVGIHDAIRRLCDVSTIPIIVKETGFGIAPALISDLIESGVSYVDVAGSGGTNWVSVEAYRGDDSLFRDASEFEDWGIPTAHILAAVRETYGHTYDGQVLASGGVRTGQDVAKSIGLGARAAGLALPLIRAEVAGGVDAVIEMLEHMVRTIRAAMVLTGSANTDQLRHAPMWAHASFQSEVHAISEASPHGHDVPV